MEPEQLRLATVGVVAALSGAAAAVACFSPAANVG